MSDIDQSSTNLTRRAIVAFQAGRPESARELLGEAIQADPANELAWLWLAALAHRDEEKRYCLDRALEINPEGAARDALADLAEVKPVAPAYVAAVDDLPLPKEIMQEQGKQTGSSRSWRWILLGVAGVALLAGFLLFVRPRLEAPKDSLYLAFVGPVTGPSANVGQEMLQNAKLAVERLNAAGGIDHRMVELLVYDDQNDPVLARQRAEEVVKDGRALAVLGHNSSAATMAGGEIYKAAGLPSISATASADEVTKDNPWGFTTIFNNSAEGDFLGVYIPQVLGQQKISVVYTDELYGRSLQQAFVSALPPNVTVANTWRIDMSKAERDRSVQAAIEAIAAAPDPGAIVLATSRPEAKDLILGLRRKGVKHQLIGTDAMGSIAFAELFKDEPEEKAQPGFFTDGIYVATPVIYDSAPADAQTLAADYSAKYGVAPSWRGVKVYDSALAVFEAVRRASAQNTAASRQEDRNRIREQLARLNSRDNSIAGLNGPVYFNADGAGITPVAVGIFQHRDLLSAPVQLQPAENLGRTNVSEEIAAGKLFQIHGQYLRPARVVYTGATISELSDLDPQAGTAKFDFYLWFRYPGDDDATDIQFVNQAGTSPLLGTPIEEATIDGLKYRLYRVRGVFKQNLDYHDYPFDRQTVGLRVQNARLSRDEIIYVVDRRGLLQASGSDLPNNATEFANVDNWHVRGPVELFQNTVSQDSSFGDPRLYRSNGKLDFSEFHVDVNLGRDLLSFLVRNLLPLGLILVILYISLFFSHEDQTTDRVSTAVTVLLTAAVLLGAIYASLPVVGYTVAIEYGFYIFFGLTLGAVFLALIGSRLYKSGREEILRRLDLGARILYPLIVLAAIIWYAVQYVPKLAS